MFPVWLLCHVFASPKQITRMPHTLPLAHLRTGTHTAAHLTPTHPHTHTDAELSALAIKCRGFMGTCHLACLSAPHFATDKHKECVSVSAQGSFTVGVS